MGNEPSQQRCRLGISLLSLGVATTFVQKKRMPPSRDYITPEKQTPQRRSKRAHFKNSRYREDTTATIQKWIDREDEEEERCPRKRRGKCRGGGGRKGKRSVKDKNNLFDGLEGVSFTYSELEVFNEERSSGGGGGQGEEDHIQRFADAWREYEGDEIDLECEEELEDEDEEEEEEEEEEQTAYLHHHHHNRRIYFFKVPRSRMQERRVMAGI